MTEYTDHRLDGLEHDNLLAFLALLGLLRTLEAERPEWYPRVRWALEDLPLRPALRTPAGVDQDAILNASAAGLDVLAEKHEFDGMKDLPDTPEDAARFLKLAAHGSDQDRYLADLWASLLSDAALKADGRKVEPTPLCLLSGQGHQHFLERMNQVPKQKSPPDRGRGHSKNEVTETKCLREALFAPWKRPDATFSFRWDPNEDVRYALRSRNPSDAKTKESTQHGANRLAAIGISVLTVVPMRRFGTPRLAILGGHREPGAFIYRWPIWKDPVSLAGIRGLLSHPGLEHSTIRDALGIVEIRHARRISIGRYMNFTSAEPVQHPAVRS